VNGLVVGPQPYGKQFLGFGPQNMGVVLAENEGGMWRHREACANMKQSHEETMVVRSTFLELDHIYNASRIKWFG
jgi:hypothetical protein